ncbi:MAG: RNA polymerase sigma factor, partial [Pirellulales bacterium]
LAEWAEFHAQIEQLPDDAREVFDLVWYGGLSQADAAEVLEVDPRTVRRRWRQARLSLSALRSGKPLE